MVWKIGIFLSILVVVIGYLRWKARSFQRPSEIEESIGRSYSDFRAFEDAGLKYTVVDVGAEKPGFPERLYKYIPLIGREGFVDITRSISPYGMEQMDLPDVDEITRYDLFPSDAVEIRNVTWSDSPVRGANIQLRVHLFQDRYVINAVHAAMVSIVELITGEIDKQFHAQFNHTDLNESNLNE